MKVLTITELKEHNKKRLYNLIITNPNISRSELAKLSHLSGGTITALVKELMLEGLIEENKIDYATGGRPKVGLIVKSVDSNILIIEIMQRKISVKSYDIYNELLFEETHTTNYLNGNIIVDTALSHLNNTDKKYTKVGFLFEENINANEISYLFSTGLSESQISIQDAIKMYCDIEVVLEYSLKYTIENSLKDMELEDIDLYAYINFNDFLNTFIYSNSKQISFTGNSPYAIDLSLVLEKLGQGSAWNNLLSMDISNKNIIEEAQANQNRRLNNYYKKFVHLLGEAIMMLQVFYPLDAVFLYNDNKSMQGIDDLLWKYVSKQSNNKLIMIQSIVSVNDDVAKCMNKELLLGN